jgi:hypothetical protein
MLLTLRQECSKMVVVRQTQPQFFQRSTTYPSGLDGSIGQVVEGGDLYAQAMYASYSPLPLL